MFGGLILALGTLFYLPMTLLAPLSEAEPVVPVHSVLPATAAAPAWPGYGASAIGAVGFPGVLAASGSRGGPADGEHHEARHRDDGAAGDAAGGSTRPVRR